MPLLLTSIPFAMKAIPAIPVAMDATIEGSTGIRLSAGNSDTDTGAHM